MAENYQYLFSFSTDIFLIIYFLPLPLFFNSVSLFFSCLWFKFSLCVEVMLLSIVIKKKTFDNSTIVCLYNFPRAIFSL